MSKVKALAEFLEVPVEEIVESDYDVSEFYHGNDTYHVLTDEEANNSVYDYIENHVWAFNADFIIAHSSVLDHDDASYEVIEAIANLCENGNKAMITLIDDLDSFVDDAVRSDGRGHFLSSYDGAEYEHGKYFIYRN